MDYTFTTPFFLWISLVVCSEKTAIPQHLLDCYRRPPPPLLPMTVETMIEIIRKISYNSYASQSLTQQIADILHWFSIDGLERNPNVVKQNVIPYHRIGFQAHKQDLLFEKLIPIQRRDFELFSLSTSEKCTLHSILSTSIDYWERGDEAKTCPDSPQQFRNMTPEGGAGMYSVCPLEGGVVLTPSGSVSAGRVLTALVAALNPQQVTLSQLITNDQLVALRMKPADTINNIWAATVAGDLAEVAVEQNPLYDMNIKIGISERWHDTNIPSRLYFDNVQFSVIEKHKWQITDAEILGGIDGLLLGIVIQKLRHSMSTILRLPQLLEMYYSRWSITKDHVCNRKSTFNNLIGVNKKDLIEQTKKFAALLSIKTTTYFTDSSIMVYRCIKAVEKFILYYPGLMVEDTCPQEDKTFPRLNLVVVIDATWPPYSALQFLMSLTQKVDISYYGGRITVVNGDSSDIRVNSTSNPTILYQQMQFSNSNDPRGLRLHKSLTALKNLLEEENKIEQDLSRPRQSERNVVVVIGYSSTIDDKDMKDSTDILKSVKSQNPAVQYVYVTSSVNKEQFKQLLNVEGSASFDTLLSTDDPRTENIISLLQSPIRTERSLKPAYCKNDLHQWPEVWYNEYVTPSQTNAYWIHPAYLCSSLDIVKITFKNYGYGELFVCMSRGDQRGDCKMVRSDTEVTHAVLRPCDPSTACQPLYFTVNVLQTYSNCAEYECRYPNQVKFSIIVQDLHCINLNTDVCSKASLVVSYFSCIGQILILIVVTFINLG